MCMYVYIRIHVYIEVERERERFLPFSIVFIIKNNKVKVSFSSKWHGKFSQIIFCYGSKKLCKSFFWMCIPGLGASKPTTILRFTRLMKIHRNMRMKLYCKSVLSNHKSWLMVLFHGWVWLSLNVSSCINSRNENCKCRSKRTVFHKGMFWFVSRGEHHENKLFAGIWKKCVQIFTSFTALTGRTLVS